MVRLPSFQLTLHFAFSSMCIGACLPEFETVSGTRILYEYSETAQPCAGTVSYLDRVVYFLEGQLAVSAPRSLRYSWLIDDEAVPPSIFKPGAVDWVVGRHAISSRPALVHEIVHLVTGNAAPPFFREGLATAYDPLQTNGVGERYRDSIDFDPRDTMSALNYLDVDYAEAGLFVSFLLTRYGPERFQSFYTRIPSPSSMASIRLAFRSVYGVELDAEAEIFMAGPPDCEPDYFSLQVDDCSAPLQDWENGQWSTVDVLDCEMLEVVGGIRPSQGETSFRQFTLEVATPGDYLIEATGDPLETVETEDVMIRLGPCFGCVWDDPNELLRLGEARTLNLQVGKHYLRVSGNSARAPLVRVVLRAV
jgi:hypothetical protein